MINLIDYQKRQLLFATVASPVTLTTVLNISKILSTAKIKAIPSGSIPIELNTMTNITIPAPGAAAAPIDAKGAVAFVG